MFQQLNILEHKTSLACFHTDSKGDQELSVTKQNWRFEITHSLQPVEKLTFSNLNIVINGKV
jgi:hypothetical protein